MNEDLIFAIRRSDTTERPIEASLPQCLHVGVQIRTKTQRASLQVPIPRHDSGSGDICSWHGLFHIRTSLTKDAASVRDVLVVPADARRVLEHDMALPYRDSTRAFYILFWPAETVSSVSVGRGTKLSIGR